MPPAVFPSADLGGWPHAVLAAAGGAGLVFPGLVFPGLAFPGLPESPGGLRRKSAAEAELRLLMDGSMHARIIYIKLYIRQIYATKYN